LSAFNGFLALWPVCLVSPAPGEALPGAGQVDLCVPLAFLSVLIVVEFEEWEVAPIPHRCRGCGARFIFHFDGSFFLPFRPLFGSLVVAKHPFGLRAPAFSVGSRPCSPGVLASCFLSDFPVSRRPSVVVWFWGVSSQHLRSLLFSPFVCLVVLCFLWP